MYDQTDIVLDMLDSRSKKFVEKVRVKSGNESILKAYKQKYK